MRKYIFIMMVASAAISCSIDAPIEPVDRNDNAMRKEIIISASTGTEADTRTVLVDGKSVYWTLSDEITIFSGGESSKFTSLNTVNAKSALFKGMISVVSGVNEDSPDSYIYALYPYNADATYSDGVITTSLPSEQTARALTFGDHLLVTAGRSHTFDIGFGHVCSGVRFTLTRSDIRSVTLSANGGEALAGTFSFGFDKDNHPEIKEISKPVSSITVTAPNEGTFIPGISYYIVTLPVTFSEGLTFTVRTGTASGSLATSASFSLNQGTFRPLSNADATIGLQLDDPELALPFCIEAVEDATITVSNPLGLSLEYSKDMETWQADNSATIAIDVVSKERVYLRGNNSTADWYSNFNDCTQINVSGKYYAYGNILSLIYAADFPYMASFNGRFNNLFYGEVNLLSHPEKKLLLPAVNLVTSFAYEEMFSGCISLTEAPELPATKLSWHCYRFMFRNCKSLVKAPVLPAMTLAPGCYAGMFSGCSSLAEAPELPALSLADQNCYGWMFSYCTALKTAPKLPATQLENGCYNAMFEGCSGLVVAPELPATDVKPYCYSYMFSQCMGLKTAPDLPATTLAENCYNNMFNGCLGLNVAPDLLATSLVNGCYMNMFRDCSNLCYIKMMATEIPPSSRSLSYWVSNVASSGTFVMNPEAGWWVTGDSGIPEGWTISYEGYESDIDEPSATPLTFEAIKPGNVEISNPFGLTMEYRLNEGPWISFNLSRFTVAVSEGDHLSLRGDNSSYSANYINPLYTNINCTAPCLIYGNIMSLIDSKEYEDLKELTEPYTFMSLFKDNANIYVHPDRELLLPASELTYCCYRSMFSGCSSLAAAPKLPATSLADDCYSAMFSGCTSLVEAPELPATSLAVSCYFDMFNGCTSLVRAPELPATILMSGCYSGMFMYCSKLLYIKMMATDISAKISTYRWVDGVAENGTFVKNSGAEWDAVGDDGVPEGWTVEYADN